jgi:hypothetical protein
MLPITQQSSNKIAKLATFKRIFAAKNNIVPNEIPHIESKPTTPIQD